MTDERVQLLIQNFQTMDEPEFEQWIESQPDSEELSKELLSLFLTGQDKEDGKPRN